MTLWISVLLAGGVAAQEDPPTEVPAREPSGGDLPPEEPGFEPSDPDAPISAPPKKRSPWKRMYLGGWLGATSGDNIDLVEVAPELGFRVTPKFHLGGSLIYRYRKDKRFEPDLSTTDLGGSLFGRYFAYGPLFVHLGAERVTWEFLERTPEGLGTVDADHMAILLGPGFALPMGANAATYFSVLYDLNYDNDGPNPYDRPWFVRIGVGVGL